MKRFLLSLPFLSFLGFVAALLCLYILVGVAGQKLGFRRVDSYAVKGVDVSHHQGPINWKILARQTQVTFTYIKATEGTSFRDPAFRRNWKASKAAGLKRGAYHFYRFCVSGAAQFRNVKATVPRERDALPLTVDLEFWANCKQPPSAKALRRELGVFLKLARAHYGKRPLLYVTWNFYHRVLLGSELRGPVWVSDFWGYPRFGTEWLFWQHSEKGRLPGVYSNVDLDVFRLDAAAFRRWARDGELPGG